LPHKAQFIPQGATNIASIFFLLPAHPEPVEGFSTLVPKSYPTKIKKESVKASLFIL
jgi:hypothetical protein